MPQEIEKLEAEIAAIEEELGNPDLYTADPDKFDALSSRLNEAQQEKTTPKINGWKFRCLKKSWKKRLTFAGGV